MHPCQDSARYGWREVTRVEHFRLGTNELETLNWSLGGFLATAMLHDIREGQILTGTLRIIGETEEGEFVARVIRYDDNKLTLAVRFVDLDDKTFTILDRAARRRFRSAAVRVN